MAFALSFPPPEARRPPTPPLATPSLGVWAAVEPGARPARSGAALTRGRSALASVACTRPLRPGRTPVGSASARLGSQGPARPPWP